MNPVFIDKGELSVGETLPWALCGQGRVFLMQQGGISILKNSLS